MLQWTTTIQSNIIVLLFLPVKFGKGIYFADMSSKSANYCFANQKNDQGLLLLSEVVFFVSKTSKYLLPLPEYFDGTES